jgi:ParB/RepB/Spo0J family partition protein
MSRDRELQVILPPDTGVLVVGIQINAALRKQFGDRAITRDHWELSRPQDFPTSTAAVCMSSSLGSEIRTRIKETAQAIGIQFVTVVEDANSLNARLESLLSVNGNSHPAVVVSPSNSETQGAIDIPIAIIRPNSNQPRKYFNQSRLQWLADSIRDIGQKVPALVRRIAKEGSKHQFEIIEGERRWRACKIARVSTLRVCVETVADAEEQFFQSITANNNREGHTTMEIARSMERMLGFSRMRNLNAAQKTAILARVFGFNEVYVYRYLGLLKLPKEVQDMLEPDANQRINLSVGIALCGVKENPDLTTALAKKIASEGLTTTKATALIRYEADRVGQPLRTRARTRKASDELRNLRDFLERTSNRCTTIVGTPKNGLEQWFSTRPEEDLASTIERTELTIKKLQEIYGVLKSLKRAKKTS